MNNLIQTKRASRQFRRRTLLKVLSVIGGAVIAGGWGISRTRLMWQINEYVALASLGGKAQQAQSTPYVGIETKVAFGVDPQQYALVYAPQRVRLDRNAIIFFLHGGGWSMGDPLQYRFIGRFFAQLGYPTILGGYRLAPKHQFPAQLDDACAGLKAGLAQLTNNGISVNQLVLGGHSAGAQLASLMTYNPSILQSERPLFSGLLNLSGPLNFAFCQSGDIRRLIDAYLGNAKNWDIANPITYANPNSHTPVLCLHGEQDPLVDFANSMSFVNKINEGPVKRAQLQLLPNTYHSDTLNLFLEQSEQTKIVTDWLENLDRKDAAPR